MPQMTFRSLLPVPASALFEWHLRRGAFERLTPPWETIEVLQPLEKLEEGAVMIMKVGIGPFKQRWEALHNDIQEGRLFRDEQVKGPFSRWSHAHRFLDQGPQESVLEDALDYSLPMGALGSFFGGRFTEKKLRRMFTFRHLRTLEDLVRHARFAEKPRQTIAISGASGLLGQALTSYLTTAGHEVIPLVRKPPTAGAKAIFWNPLRGEIDAASLEGIDAVIHLSGESIAQRWTAASKASILESRVKSTDLLSKTIASAKRPPKAFLSASAIGFYGPRPFEDEMTEESDGGTGFLAEICKAWEAATKPAEDAGIRVVRMRIAVVFSAKGGALPQMALPIRLGVGGRVGDGQQGISWISQEDILGAIEFLLHRDDLSGAFNLTAPNPATNAQITAALGRVLRRPTFATVPAFVIKALLGEMGQVLLLEGSRVFPKRLTDAGFSFLRPTLDDALLHEFGLYPPERLLPSHAVP